MARAIDATGNRVSPGDPSAVRWCVEGAIARACGEHGITPPYFMVLLDTVLEEELDFSFGMPLFEQHYDHHVVLQVLRRTCERAPGD